MSLFRPEVLRLLGRWFDPAAGAATIAVGVWTVLHGGFLPIITGVAFVALGAGWAILGLRRLRFETDAAAPGVVEVDEARVRYLHPRMGGEISLNDLVELRLAAFRGRRMWQLTDATGRGLLIPLDAAGAPALFDTFAALPGLSSAALVTALQAPAALGATVPATALDDRPVWRRPGAAPLNIGSDGAGRA
ncbi:hypothetical protein LHP98_13580 [Rhodobacter sp. Har01]|uniref:hypothetical protein n=1 Tax=Rhodobacter sp. Har01 TaxID=2883999 RepID=UPI001D074F20|nr:hypothetical protein [Rhodobacter sp. Har01]MCB6179151.1 hypothetical protein [Rhodobacter sp. Har01]